jgi:glyoxylase-like metal-dependent hydrolase (beta-lactamase superfamily II)
MARTLLGRPVYWTGVYFLDGLLVDSGPPNLAREMARLCRELAVHQCVTSHHHEDHSGNHRLLQEQFHIVPLAHAGGVGRIAAPESRPQLYRRVAFGVPAPAETQPAGDWVETPRFRLQVVPTPGHAEDHIALWEPERRWLFSGDLFLGPRLKYLRSDEDIYALLDSLRRVIALEPETLFCQHRGRVENAGSALRQKLDSLVELGERIRALAGKGMDEEAIARALPGSDLVWRVWTGGHFSKRNFVHAFLRQTPRS